MNRFLMAIGLAAGLLVALSAGVAPTSAAIMPLGQHCGDTGPLNDPEYCGCTWGEVLYRGQPVVGAELTLTFAGQTITDTAAMRISGELPFYSVTAHDLGARRGDVITLTASFAGEVITRTLRASPDEDGEQHIVLAFPERGAFAPSLNAGYTRTLTLAGGVLWAGGADGLAAVDPDTGSATPQVLPWQGGVVATAGRTGGDIWAAGTGGLARLANSVWQPAATPAALGVILALAIDPSTGELWAGGTLDGQATLARYDGAWHLAPLAPAPNGPITAMTVDGRGTVWVGTFGSGVYKRRDDGGWTRYRDIDGLATSRVLALAADEDFVWIGGEPYLSGLGQPRGGISRYDLEQGIWHNCGLAEGLPPVDIDMNQSAPAPVLALAVDATGTPWAGTSAGIYALVTPTWWNRHSAGTGAGLGAVMAVAASDQVFAATQTGVSRFADGSTPGQPPHASITSGDAVTGTKGLGSTFLLSGTAEDADENGATVAAWDWQSDLDGPICTRPTCTLKVDSLSLGAHVLTLTVLDDEGQWSPSQTTRLVVTPALRLFLPALVRSASGP